MEFFLFFLCVWCLQSYSEKEGASYMRNVKKLGKFLLNAAVLYQDSSSGLNSTVCFADADSSYWSPSTSCRWIIDAEGNRFKLKSVKWWGASDRLQVV